MAIEHIIHTHEPYSEGGQHDSHPSMRSHRRGLDSIVNKLREWRGETVEISNIDVMPEDQEITLWNSDWIHEVALTNDIYKEATK